MSAESRVPRRIRVFVWTFLAAFFVCGFARIEAWPLTSWRLFSRVRHAVQTSWSAVTVDHSGREHQFPTLGQSYRGTTHVLDSFSSLSRQKQIAACDAWANGARHAGQDVEAVRIYRVTSDVSHRAGDRGAPPLSRTLSFTCMDGRVERAR